MKPLGGSVAAKEDLLAFPAAVVQRWAMCSSLPRWATSIAAAKPLRGFGGAKVLEVVEDHRGNTYRAI